MLNLGRLSPYSNLPSISNLPALLAPLVESFGAEEDDEDDEAAAFDCRQACAAVKSYISPLVDQARRRNKSLRVGSFCIMLTRRACLEKYGIFTEATVRIIRHILQDFLVIPQEPLDLINIVFIKRRPSMAP